MININSISDNILYKGKVNIAYFDKFNVEQKRIGFNSGKIRLFTFITNALAGKTVNEWRPQKIDLLYDANPQDPAEQNKHTVLAYPIAYMGAPKVYNNGALQEETNQIVYLFTVPGVTIINRDKNINLLRLLDSTNTVCAEITLEGDDIIKSVDSSSNIVIEWTLTFSSI